MKKSYLTVVLILTCLLGLGGSARAARDNVHSVEISDVVQIGSTKLKPGNYTVKWQGTGPTVQVSFQQNGKTVVTVPGTLKTNDDQVTQDAIVTEATTTGTSTLKEIDFGHHKEALVFDQNPGGMQLLQRSLGVDLQLRPQWVFEGPGSRGPRAGSS